MDDGVGNVCAEKRTILAICKALRLPRLSSQIKYTPTGLKCVFASCYRLDIIHYQRFIYKLFLTKAKSGALTTLAQSHTFAFFISRSILDMDISPFGACHCVCIFVCMPLSLPFYVCACLEKCKHLAGIYH